MLLTNKQRSILACVIFGNSKCEGVLKDWLSIGELIEVLPYETTRDSLQFSIRALIKKDLVTKGKRILRDGRWHVPIIPTDLAIEIVPQLKGGDIFVSAEEFDNVVFEGF